MDPITLATIVATLLATKATEKVGEKLGEGAFNRLLEAFHRNAPDTVKRLAAVADPNVIDAEIIEDVQRVLAEPEVKAAVDAVAAEIGADSIGFQSLTKLAEKIGVVNLGKVENQTNNITI
jgi:hypothetical protein